MRQLYGNIGRAINTIANVSDVKNILSVLLSGETTSMPFIVAGNSDKPIRMNRKFAGDVDTLVTAGDYRIGSSSTNTGFDGERSWMDVKVYLEDDEEYSSIMQINTNEDGSSVLRRYLNGTTGTWSAWA